MLSQESTEWVSSLGLTQQDKKEIEGKSSMLNDRHMHAAHKLLRMQFSRVEGCSSTLLIQLKSFPSITSDCSSGTVCYPFA